MTDAREANLPTLDDQERTFFGYSWYLLVKPCAIPGEVHV